MADTKKTTTKKTGRVTVRLPRLKGHNARQEEFYSVNGKNYIIQRGKNVEVPLEVAEVIKNNEMAEDYAMNYIDDLLEAESEKKREYGVQ